MAQAAILQKNPVLRKVFRMLSAASRSPTKLPSDHRHHFGGLLFLVSLLIFFLASILLYGIYAYGRRDDPETLVPLPKEFLISTACLLVISGLVHAATRMIRHERRLLTSGLLAVAGLTAIAFMSIQFFAMDQMLGGRAWSGGTGRGVAGMIAVLALLHALHVGGGVVALTVVSIRSMIGKYDHERHWPVDFAAQYWHFLDIVWIAMLIAFWSTSGGF